MTQQLVTNLKIYPDENYEKNVFSTKCRGRINNFSGENPKPQQRRLFLTF